MLGRWQDVQTPPVLYFFLLLGYMAGVLEDALAQLNKQYRTSTVCNACAYI